jgi:Fe-S cluster assembly iron-binding protein IscA
MLTLTDNASTAVKSLAERTLGTEPDATTGGLRISTADGNSSSFNVAVAPQPEPADEVVESGGARVFLDGPASAAVDGKILDAQPDGSGALRFALLEAV